MRIANFRETLGHRQYGKVGWLAVRYLVPMEGRGYSSIRNRAHGIGGAGRSILGVLIIIQEHPMTLFLSPFRSCQGGHTTLDFTRKSKRGAAHLVERPALLDSDIHVHPTRTAGFGPATKPHLLKKRLHLKSNRPNIFPTHTWARIQIDPQFVRMVEIVRPHEVGM